MISRPWVAVLAKVREVQWCISHRVLHSLSCTGWEIGHQATNSFWWGLMAGLNRNGVTLWSLSHGGYLLCALFTWFLNTACRSNLFPHATHLSFRSDTAMIYSPIFVNQRTIKRKPINTGGCCAMSCQCSTQHGQCFYLEIFRFFYPSAGEVGGLWDS